MKNANETNMTCFSLTQIFQTLSTGYCQHDVEMSTGYEQV